MAVFAKVSVALTGLPVFSTVFHAIMFAKASIGLALPYYIVNEALNYL